MSPLIPNEFWDDIPILHTPIPYADLQAQGSYGRVLNLAEDVPPTTSVLVGHERQSNGALVPHLVNTDASGNLLFNPAAGTEKVEVLLSDGTPVDATHPFPVTSSGGGGITALNYGSIRWSQANVGQPTSVSSLTGVPTYILGYTVSWRNDYPARTESAIQLYMTDQGGANLVYLGQWHMLNTEEASDVFVAGPFVCMFPFPMSVSAQWPTATGLQVWMSCSTLGVQASGLVHYA